MVRTAAERLIEEARAAGLPSYLLTSLAEAPRERHLLLAACAAAAAAHLALLVWPLPFTPQPPFPEPRPYVPYRLMPAVRLVAREVPPERAVERQPERPTVLVPVPDVDPVFDSDPVELVAVDPPATLPIEVVALPEPPLVESPIAEDGVRELTPEMVPPRALYSPHPPYPEMAHRLRITGIVTVRTVIDAAGGVAAIEVLRGLPAGLTESTVETLRTWRFAPATLRGRPVAVYYTLTVDFRLH